MCALIWEWLNNFIPYFDFWNEIREHTKLGSNSNRIVEFFPIDEMEDLSDILSKILENPQIAWGKKPRNKMPLFEVSWMNYLPEIKPDKDPTTDPQKLLNQMIKDIYKVIKAMKEA
jgi:hypothetical protein